MFLFRLNTMCVRRECVCVASFEINLQKASLGGTAGTSVSLEKGPNPVPLLLWFRPLHALDGEERSGE